MQLNTGIDLSTVEKQRALLEALAPKLGFSADERSPWYSITNQNLIALGGSRLLRRYKGSLFALLTAVYSDYKWEPLKFGKAPRKYWRSIENQRSFMVDLGKKLGFPEGAMMPWYKITLQTIIDNGGSALLAEYKGVLSTLLAAVFPQHQWDPLKFDRAPRKYWADIENQRLFLNNLSKKLGFKEGDREAWYKVSNITVLKNGGSAVLSHYKGSLSALLAAVYPDFEWDPLRFDRSPRNYWKSLDNQRRFLEQLGPKLGVKEGLDGWYSVSNLSVLENGGSGLLAQYNGSLSAALAIIYSEHPWDPLRFEKAPRSHWASLENQRAFMDELGKKLNIKEGDRAPWYNVSAQLIAENGGSGLMALYHNVPSAALGAIYPDFKWDPLKFAKAPRHYWRSMANQRAFMDRLGDELGFPKGDLEGWYKVPTLKFIEMGGSALLSRYDGSLSSALEAIYPEHKWDLLKFTRAPQNHWQSIENQHEMIDEIREKIGVKEGDFEAWYKVTSQQFIDAGGSGLLAHHGGSLSSALAAVYNDYKWDPTKFSKTPRNYWKSIEKHREFMDALGTKLGFKEGEREGWYAVSHRLISENGGSKILAQYNGSLPDLLATVYSDYSWSIWKFPRRTSRVRSNRQAVDELLTSVEKALDLKEPRDWYRVTQDQLNLFGLARVFRNKKGDLLNALRERYPNERWQEETFLGRGYRKASQRWLASTLRQLLPDEEILENSSHSSLRDQGTGEALQLDVFLPQLKLAFEYQGTQHYEQLPVYGQTSTTMTRDAAKDALCDAHGITLIQVPYWWNKKRGALLASILGRRPDIFSGPLKAFLDEARRESAEVKLS